ncbi:MAG TPA: aminoacyl-tRNA hydrolase [Candidatus Paceibacterota bacterium]|nr:aminoacyl-tRNA hydrolase [Candidatus Paceibacterota bacterium]
MTTYILGLGNPGAEYEQTRHNAGRLALALLAQKPPENASFEEWKLDKKMSALVSKGKIGSTNVVLALPETYMNKSGVSVKPLALDAKKAAAGLIVVHDDMDLPLGTIKVSFDRGAGGHKGIESIIATIKTKAFTRVRIGVCPTTPGGKLKKPQAGDQVVDFIIGKFKPSEAEVLKKVLQQAAAMTADLVTKGRVWVMNNYN